MKFIEEYHCWPYDVKVYTISEIKVDSVFYNYPHKKDFIYDPDYKLSKWMKYENIDTSIWYGLNKTLSQCDDNIELYNKISNGKHVFYSGVYRYYKDRNGKSKRNYETVLFLDIEEKKLHTFKNIDKIY